MSLPNRLFRLTVWTLLLALCLLLVSRSLARRESVFDQLALLVDIRHNIVRDYVEPPDEKQLIQAAARAMVEALDDPYSMYLSPEELEPFDKQVRGTFSGIGAEVDLHEGRLRIVTPLDDSPAFKAGVMAGDIVLEIDGQSTEGLSLTQCIQRLQGPEGTQVKIKVRHLSGEESDLIITRAQINVRTVRGLRRLPDGKWDYLLDPVHRIGYVRISQFTETTPDDLRQTLDQLLAQNPQGLVLDLRFNPGGLLETAVQVADLFLPSGKTIVSVKGRAVPDRTYYASDDYAFPDVPMVVLANEASASAAEVVAGALADNGRAQLIGTRTFGKGSVQQVKPLADGQGALKLTNAYYYLPSGRNIHRKKDATLWGVDPQDGFWVPMTPEQTRQMLQLRRERDILKPNGSDSSEPPTLTPQLIREQWADPQLAAALEALLGKLQTGQWPIVGLSGTTELARQNQLAHLQRQRDFLQERLQAIQKEIAKLEQATSDQPPADQVSAEPPEESEPN